ncbi:helix-turn-helix domain-containing protein [Stutzerimonas azotifigens]|uniref:helix-turn-helix domain-containing protein n=1 Tax=Stutzerimonas azotifigens TaxID=291995 RepID=UPI00048A0CEB|nr:AraC family transcriptional regulator [Stutzerimonas azotifigens]
MLSLRRYTREVIAHSHSHVQLVFGLHGRLDMEVDGHGNQVLRQMMAVIPERAHHACDSRLGSDCLVLDLPGEPWLRERLGEHADDGLRLLERPGTLALDASQQQLVGWLAASALHDPAIAQQGAALLLTTLVRERRLPPPAPRATLEALYHYIDRHLAHPLAVEDLALQAGLSVSRLHARFLEETGATPIAFVRQRRLQRGRELLRDTALPVGEIATQVGYASQSAFTAALVRAFGCTPRSLRREARDKSGH